MHPLEIMVNAMALAFGVAVLAFLAVLEPFPAIPSRRGFRPEL